MSRRSVLMTLALMVSACGGSNGPAAPPSPTAARPPDPTFTVSGVASKEGFEDPLVPNVPEAPDAADTSRKVIINGDTHYEIRLVRQ